MKRILSLVLACGAGAVGCRVVRAQPPTTPVSPLAVLATAQVDDARITESSGLCAGSYPPYLWTHNDSGDTARAFLIAPTGAVIAEVRLKGAQNRDWEDVGSWGGWVYCADIGDNLSQWPSITVYRFREASVASIVAKYKRNPTPQGEVLEVPCEHLALTYPDGAHDAETLLVRHDGSLVIVTKNVAGSTIYETPQPFKDGVAMRLWPIGHLVFGDSQNLLANWREALATGGDISPDGKRVTIITYTHLYEWTLPDGKNAWTEVWKTTPRVYRLPQLRQTEAVCYTPDGKNWWISSEGRPMELRWVSTS